MIGDYCRVYLTRNPLDKPIHLHRYSERERKNVPQPSDSESLRLYRAIWRWHFYTKLFGVVPPGEHNTQHGLYTSSNDSDDEIIADIFLRLFPVYEVEEMACLVSYAKETYLEFLEDAHWECNRHLLNSLITQGPEYLYWVLKSFWKQEKYPLLGAERLHVRLSIRDLFDAYERVVDSGNWPWKGEHDRRGEDHTYNSGWLWASSRGIANTDLRLRRWGYVFWDRSRFDGWGITKARTLRFPWHGTPRSGRQ